MLPQLPEGFHCLVQRFGLYGFDVLEQDDGPEISVHERVPEFPVLHGNITADDLRRGRHGTWPALYGFAEFLLEHGIAPVFQERPPIHTCQVPRRDRPGIDLHHFPAHVDRAPGVPSLEIGIGEPSRGSHVVLQHGVLFQDVFENGNGGAVLSGAHHPDRVVELGRLLHLYAQDLGQGDLQGDPVRHDVHLRRRQPAYLAA